MEHYIIDESSKLFKLISGKKLGNYDKIILDMEQLDNEEKMIYERKLNALHNDCGCELGALCCFISICAYLIFSLIDLKMSNGVLLRNGMIIFFASALIGKIVGMVIAKMKFKKTIRSLMAKQGEVA